MQGSGGTAPDAEAYKCFEGPISLIKQDVILQLHHIEDRAGGAIV